MSARAISELLFAGEYSGRGLGAMLNTPIHTCKHHAHITVMFSRWAQTVELAKEPMKSRIVHVDSTGLPI